MDNSRATGWEVGSKRKWDQERLQHHLQSFISLENLEVTMTM